MRGERLVGAALVAALAVGCSDGATDTQEPSLDVLAPPPSGQGRQLSMQQEVQPGEEIQYCQYMVLPAGIDVGRFEHKYSLGSHHLVLYTTELTPEDVASDLERFDCDTRDSLKFDGIVYA